MVGLFPDSDQVDYVGQARTVDGAKLETLLYHNSQDVLTALLENPRLGEQHLLVLLSRNNLSRETVAKIAKNREWMNSYSMKLAVVRHPQTPRHVAISFLKFIYVFDLLGMALTPGVSAELKRRAEDAILSQITGLALGQRISLARRGSLRVVQGLLQDRDRGVIEAALSNPSLNEHAVASALLLDKAPSALAEAILKHPRWFVRRSVKQALMRSQHLSLARLLGIFPDLSTGELEDLISDRRVASNIRAYASRTIAKRSRQINANALS